MMIGTKYFGELDYHPSEVITFIEQGIIGFEDEREFLLIPFEEDAALYCLQSVKTPGLAFVAVNPFSLDPEYAPVLQPEELKIMGAGESTELHYYTFCAVKSPVARSTVNLRCPIVIEEESRHAMQVILENSQYGMRHLLSDIKCQEGKPC